MPKQVSSIQRLEADQLVHDLLTHRIRLFKQGQCILDCDLRALVSDPEQLSLLPTSIQKYLLIW